MAAAWLVIRLSVLVGPFDSSKRIARPPRIAWRKTHDDKMSIDSFPVRYLFLLLFYSLCCWWHGDKWFCDKADIGRSDCVWAVYNRAASFSGRAGRSPFLAASWHAMIPITLIGSRFFFLFLIYSGSVSPSRVKINKWNTKKLDCPYRWPMKVSDGQT